MDVDQSKSLRRELEVLLFDTIKDFESRTSLKVTRVNLVGERTIGQRHDTLHFVMVDVEL
jgi:hypothetical protein